MEVVQGEERGDHGIIFKKVGSELCVVPGGFSDYAPSQALAISNKFGLTFFVHDEGFCVANTSDLIQASQSLGSGGAAYNAKNSAIANVHLPSTRLLALSGDELVVAACTENEVNFYNVPALINKDGGEFDAGTALLRSISVKGEECGINVLVWNPIQKELVLLLTNRGLLMQGPLSKQNLTVIAEDVEAVDWSPEGNHFCYVTRTGNIHILHSVTLSSSSCMLPQEAFREPKDNGHDAYVDTLKWVRLDTILLSYVTENDEDEEDKAWILVLLSNAGPIAQDLHNIKYVTFEGVFPSTDDSILPDEKGPLTLLNFIQPWELLVVTNRRCVDDHIFLLEWFEEFGQSEVYRCELVDDRYTPRIELQASGDDNCVVGLSVDKTTQSIQIPAPNDDSGEKLKAGPILFCMTIEGCLILFSMARINEKAKDADIHNTILELPEANDVSLLYNLELKVSDNTVPIIDEPDQKAKSADTVIDKTSSGVAVVNDKASTTVSLRSKGNARTEDTNSQQLPKTPVTINKGANAQNQDGSELKVPVVQPGHKEMYSQRQAGDPVDGTNRSNTTSGYPKTSNTTALSETESEFARELNKVKAMATKLESLMGFIEGNPRLTKGESESSFTKASVEDIECKTRSIFSQCKVLEEQLLQQKQSIVDVRDECLQVDACRVYVQSMLQQAFDGRYKELWNKQSLHPELAAMRKRLLQADQNLKQQIAELDEHLHSLELYQSQRKKLIQNVSLHSERKSFRSIQTLYDTVNTQMLIAQQLAHHLALQSEALKLPHVANGEMERLMNSSTVKLQKMTLKDTAARARNHVSPPRPAFSSEQKTSKSSMETPPNHMSQSGTRSGLQDSTRRRRDSVDKLWFDAGAAKTTVKRVGSAKKSNAFSSPTTQSGFRVESTLPNNEPNRSAFQSFQAGPQHAWTKFELVEEEEPSLSLRSGDDYAKSRNPDTGISPFVNQKNLQLPTFLATNNFGSFLTTTRGLTSEEQVAVGPESMSKSKTAQGSQAIFPSNEGTYRTASSFASTAQITKSQTENMETAGNTGIKKQDQVKTATTPAALEKGPCSSRQFSINDLDRKASKAMGKQQIETLDHSSVTQTSGLLEIQTNFNLNRMEHGKEGSEGQGNKPAKAVTSANVMLPTSRTCSGNMADGVLSPSILPSVHKESYKPGSPKEGFSFLASPNPLHSATAESPFSHLNSSSLENPSSSTLSTKPSTLPSFSLIPKVSSPSPTIPLVPPADIINFTQTSVSHVTTIPSMKPSDAMSSPIQDENTVFSSTTAPSSIFIGQVTLAPSTLSEEDDMEEEDNSIADFESSNFADFGLGSSSSSTQHGSPFGLGLSSSSTASKTSNPFGASYWSQTDPSKFSVPTGQLFKPASFGIPSLQSNASSTPSSLVGNNVTAELGGTFGLQQGEVGNSAQPNATFGISRESGSSGQQALSNALGSFGQTRQIGGPFGASPGPLGLGVGSGGFASASPGAGFASAATSGGFAGVSSGGGFAGVSSSGGFAGVAAGGGFANAATGGGFAGFSGGGIGGSPSSNVKPGGFGASSGGAYSAYGGNAKSSIFTQMRK